MRKFLLLVISALLGSQMLFAAKSNTIKITATPQTAAIYVNNQHAGYGFAEISRPTGKDKRSAIIIRNAQVCLSVLRGTKLAGIPEISHGKFSLPYLFRLRQARLSEYAAG